MKKLILILCAAVALLANSESEPKEIKAKVWTYTQTNSAVKTMLSFHTVYPSCGCPGCTGRVFEKTTTIHAVRLIQAEGATVELWRKLLWQTNQTIVVE